MAELVEIQARMASETTKGKGNLARVQRKQWFAVLHALDILSHASEDEIRLRAVQALSQAVAVYAKLLESSELMKEIDRLKADVALLKGVRSNGASGAVLTTHAGA